MSKRGWTSDQGSSQDASGYPELGGEGTAPCNAAQWEDGWIKAGNAAAVGSLPTLTPTALTVSQLGRQLWAHSILRPQSQTAPSHCPITPSIPAPFCCDQALQPPCLAVSPKEKVPQEGQAHWLGTEDHVVPSMPPPCSRRSMTSLSSSSPSMTLQRYLPSSFKCTSLMTSEASCWLA